MKPPNTLLTSFQTFVKKLLEKNTPSSSKLEYVGSGDEMGISDISDEATVGEMEDGGAEVGVFFLDSVPSTVDSVADYSESAYSEFDTEDDFEGDAGSEFDAADLFEGDAGSSFDTLGATGGIVPDGDDLLAGYQGHGWHGSDIYICRGSSYNEITFRQCPASSPIHYRYEPDTNFLHGDIAFAGDSYCYTYPVKADCAKVGNKVYFISGTQRPDCLTENPSRGYLTVLDLVTGINTYLGLFTHSGSNANNRNFFGVSYPKIRYNSDDNCIYVFGSIYKGAPDALNRCFLHKYDIDADTFTEMANPTDNLGETARYGSSMEIVTGQIYIIGGYKSSNDVPRSNIMRYTISTNTWTNIAATWQGNVKGFMNSCIINDQIYLLFGGITDGSNPTSEASIHKYTGGTTVYILTTDCGFDPRWSATGVYSDGLMWIYGGLTEQGAIIWQDYAELFYVEPDFFG